MEITVAEMLEQIERRIISEMKSLRQEDERQNEEIADLKQIARDTAATSLTVAAISVKVDTLAGGVADIAKRVQDLEAKDGISWRRLLESAASAAVGAGLISAGILQNAGSVVK